MTSTMWRRRPIILRYVGERQRRQPQRHLSSLSLLLLFLLFSSCRLVHVCAQQQQQQQQQQQNTNYYQILGVSSSATLAQIKKAYRQKARDTHPDKSDLPPEEAASNFHQVVEALEVLSDPQSRQYYDRTGRKPNPNNNQNNQQHRSSQHQQQQQWTWSWSFNSNGQQQRTYRSSSSNNQQQQQQHYRRPPPQKLKDKPMVKRAQARLLHIVSLAQFQTVLLDDDALVLDRHVLLAAVNPPLEPHVMDEMVFPFPFAGMSPQQIWWEDVLQTVLIRYHNANELTQALHLPKGSELQQPVFLFGKQGQRLEDQWERISTTNRHELEQWVWNRISVKLVLENHHTHPVEVYWIDGTQAKVKIPHLKPGASSTHYSHLTHEWYIRDVRVDAWKDSPGRWKLTTESMLLTFQLTQPHSPFVLKIPPRTCFDLSGHCGFWAQQNECTKNPNFVNDKCPLTCRQCDDAQERVWVEQALNGTYVPASADDESASQEQRNEAQEPFDDDDDKTATPGHDEL